MSPLTIYPFKADSTASLPVSDATGTLVLRGVACERTRLDTQLDVRVDGRKVAGEIFYWKPLAGTSDVIQRGLSLVKDGLGFRPSVVAKKVTKRKKY